MSAPADPVTTATPPLAPTVTAVVPTHNRPRQVVEAVRSILAQDHPGAIEVLVVFDNCDPHPIEVEDVPGRTVATLVNDGRKPGLAGARNTGILAAGGEWVAFLDDDDLWEPTKLSAQFAALDALGREAFLTTGSRIVGDDRDTLRPGPDGPVPFDALLADRIMEMSSGSFLVRRDTLLERIGLVDEELPGAYGEDWDLLLRAARLLPVVNVAAPLVRVTFHQGSFYASRWEVIADALCYLLAKHPELEQHPVGHARILGQLAFAHGALGDRAAARRHVRAALARNRREKRAYVAAAVSVGVPASWIAAAARRRGRGV